MRLWVRCRTVTMEWTCCLIAIQLTAIPLSQDEIILHGIKVLDIYEEG